jgi:aminoglycoside phosphotransferase family enzyme/predicted kinase
MVGVGVGVGQGGCDVGRRNGHTARDRTEEQESPETGEQRDAGATPGFHGRDNTPKNSRRTTVSHRPRSGHLDATACGYDTQGTLSEHGPKSGGARDLGRDLLRPGAFPDRDASEGAAELIQTHLSWVFLTRERVYKFRKPVALGFVDFSTLEARNADCLREVSLNRRLAPEVYLGLAPLETTPTPLVGPTTEDIADPGAEHCVVMRRLPAGTDARSLLDDGRLSGAHLDALADRLAVFHQAAGLGRPGPFTATEWLERVAGPVFDNFRGLASQPESPVAAELVQRTERLARAAFERLEAAFLERLVAGRIVDAHGDLHLEHIWFPDGDLRPIAIDCLQFNERLRQIDTASEVAFLAMDLAYRGAGELGERFLARYADRSGDHHLFRVVDFFISYRAAVRAKVAALTAADSRVAAAQREGARASAGRHLELAASVLADPVLPEVWVTTGIVGSGKSTVGRALAEATGAVVVSSDAIRNDVLGFPPARRAAPDAGKYSTANRRAVYQSQLERAGWIVDSGRPVVLDATFSRAVDRRRVLDWAEARGLRAILVRATADPAAIRQRLVERLARGDDASEAGPELLEASIRGYEAAEDWPSDRLWSIATDREDWRLDLKRRLEARATKA